MSVDFRKALRTLEPPAARAQELQTPQAFVGSPLRGGFPCRAEITQVDPTRLVSHMYLIQILLPLRDNEGRPFPRNNYDLLRVELTRLFGGVTAYSRAPAKGLWEDKKGQVSDEDIVVIEVMVERLDRDWWQRFRETLAERFAQEQLVVRAMPITRL